MVDEAKAGDLTRRGLLIAAVAGGTGLASTTLILPLSASESDDAVELVKQLTGKTPTG